MSSGAKRTTRKAARQGTRRGAATPFTRIRLRAAAGGRGGSRRGPGRLRGPSAPTVPSTRAKLGAPADELAVGRRSGASGPRPGRTIGLEEAGLARRVADPRRAAGPGRTATLERGVSAEGRRAGWPRAWPSSQEVVRTGMTTWTYRSSPIGLKTPGASGPWSSSANWSASRWSRTSARYLALKAIVVAVALDGRLDLARRDRRSRRWR